MGTNVLNLQITINSFWFDKIPKVRYGINQNIIDDIEITKSTIITFDGELYNGLHKFWIDFYNKEIQDCIPEKNLDTAIIIESVIIENLHLDRFKWEAKYYPRYPKLYKLKNPNLALEKKSATYLGWNGIWQLEFEMPIFTWIHKVDHLGWLYEP